MKRIITLTTDFGLKDHYVGAMKGVILSINPDAVIIDITHEIPPHDLFKGAFTLRNFHRYFPEGTVHVVIVDPGVGSKRKPVVIEADKNIFVGPDNGVFTFVCREAKAVRVFEILNPRYVLADISSTFHGRDIFAPAAAHLSIGVPIDDFGEEVENPIQLSIKEPEVRGNEAVGEIIYTDHFGNLVSNISDDLITPGSKIYVGNNMVRDISTSYADVAKGEVLAIIGSSGFLEIAVNQGRASDVIRAGDVRIIVKR